MISDPSMQLRLSSGWPGPSFGAPAVGRRGRVVILCSEAFCDRVSVCQKDTNGLICRILSQLFALEMPGGRCILRLRLLPGILLIYLLPEDLIL